MPKRTYILLTVLSLVTMWALNTFAPSVSPDITPVYPEPSGFSLDYHTLPRFLLIIFFIYTILFIIGLINCVRLCYRKITGRIFFESPRFAKSISFKDRDTWKVLFHILLFLNLSTLSAQVLARSSISLNPLHLSILINILIELAITLIIIASLPGQRIVLRTSGRSVLTILKLYTALLPLLLLSLLLNSWIMDLIRQPITGNPAIEIMLLLKNNIFTTILFFLVVILGPITEELVFRGIIFNHLRKKHGFIFSAAASSLLFSLIHRVPVNILPLFIISIAISYVYERTQNIASAILFHGFHNLLNFGALLAIKSVL